MPDFAGIRELARLARADVLSMTSAAGSGHLGGALSSIDIYAVLWSCANVRPDRVADPARDRIVVSHGHTAAAVYAVLGRLGYFDPAAAICGYRRAGSIFDGHADPKVPGVEWACGNLGQGLSAACGFALASKLTDTPYHVYCVMGDGEQQKGQIAEARRFATKYSLTNLTAIIDCNHLQAMGTVESIMPVNVEAEWAAAGWRVEHADGHDVRDIHRAVASARANTNEPTVILARTLMGKGVESIENRHEYHGAVLSPERCADILDAMGGAGDGHVESRSVKSVVSLPPPPPNTARQRRYTEPTECRTAYGNALADIAEANPDLPMAVFDCDLMTSVKTGAFADVRPESFFQCGIQEHSTATIAGAVSKSGVLAFLAEFGVFGLDEVYNQQRLNDINDASLKMICTHCGLDVAEDGKTHQCIDYISLAANLFGVKLIIPADANQADRALRYAVANEGRFILIAGRSKTPAITDENGALALEGEFEYGRADWARQGTDAVIVASGQMVWRAVEVREKLRSRGLSVGVLGLSCPLDLDEEALLTAAQSRLLITYEDHNARTGIGSLVASFIADRGLGCNLLRLGVAGYGLSGSPEDNYGAQGLDVDTVAEKIISRLDRQDKEKAR